MYTHIVKAWRDSTGYSEAVPMACPTEGDARAMFTYVLRADSGYDHAELCQATGSYVTVMETGHRVGTVAASMVPGTVSRAMEAVVDQCYRNMMDANATEPYVHADYDRWDKMLNAALVLLTNGDMPYAEALRWHFLDSGEDIRWYLERSDRNATCYDASTISQENYEAALRWAVECEENGETWVEAFPTRELAEERANGLIANTTVVDRQANDAS